MRAANNLGGSSELIHIVIHSSLYSVLLYWLFVLKPSEYIKDLDRTAVSLD